MSSRKTMIALAVPLLVVAGMVGAVFWLRAPTTALPAMAARQGAEHPGPDAPPAVRVTPATREIAQNDAPALTNESDGAMADADSDGARPKAEADIEIDGTFIVVDELDVEHSAENGSFRPLLMDGNRNISGAPVSVVAGHFRVMVPSGRKLCLQEIVLGGRNVHIDDKKTYDPSQDTSIVVQVHWPRAVTVRVIDAQTRTDLSELVVVRADDFPTIDGIHPGAALEDARAVVHATSPVRLVKGSDHPDSSGQETCWIGAPGHAWGHLDVDFVCGGELLLELGPGGELSVRIEGDLPPSPDQVELNSGDGEPWLRLRSGGGDLGIAGELVAETLAQRAKPTRFDGLPIGDYVATVEIGDSFETPLILGRSVVTLLAGQHASVSVVVQRPPAEVDPVPLRGTLFIPPAWEERSFPFFVERVGPPGATTHETIGVQLENAAAPTTPGLYHWNAGRVPPGKYLLDISSFSFQQMIDTGPDGRTDVEIRIGDPADAFVRVVDADAAATLTPDDDLVLYWNGRRPKESSRGVAEPANWDAAAQVFMLCAPAGEIEFGSDDRHFTDCVPRFVTLVPGRNDFTVHVRRLCGVTLHLEEHGTRRPWEDDQLFSIKVDRIDSKKQDAVGHGWGEQGDNVEFVTVTSPGRYRVTVPAPSGYEPIPPFEIEIPRGGFVDHAIEIVRKQ